MQAQSVFTDLEEVGRLLGAYSRAVLLSVKSSTF